MSSLEDRLARIREGSANNIPQEPLELMHRATEELVASGIHEQAVGEGDKAPEFQLKDTSGAEVSLGGLLADGPVVLTFFRGYW